MKTRIIYTKFWDDSYISDLSPSEKLVFLYYLTNGLVNIIHCYECPDKKVSFDTGIDRGILSKIKTRFHTDKKMVFFKDWIYLVNAIRYEEYKGNLNEIAIKKTIEKLPIDVLDWYNNIIDRGMIGVYIPTINHKSEIINNKSIINNKKIEDIKEEDINKIAEDYKVPVSFVLSKIDDIKNYTASTGKVYRDYLATLRNWVKKDSINIRKEAYGKSPVGRVSGE